MSLQVDVDVITLLIDMEGMYFFSSLQPMPKISNWLISKWSMSKEVRGEAKVTETKNIHQMIQCYEEKALDEDVSP